MSEAGVVEEFASGFRTEVRHVTSILLRGVIQMICPKCKDQPLTAASVIGIEVDRCTNCDGIWFDNKELMAVLDLAPPERRKLQSRKEDSLRDQTRGQCPRDQSRLLRIYSAHAESIVLDTCPACDGIWLDAGELSKLGN